MFNQLASSCASVPAVMAGRTVLLVAIKSLSACFFTLLITGLVMMAIVDLPNMSRLSPLSSSFSIPLPGSLKLNLADKHAPNAFLQLKDGILRVLAVFIQLEGQFVDPVQHLLLCRGPCCAAFLI
jgi:hypothetical protein